MTQDGRQGGSGDRGPGDADLDARRRALSSELDRLARARSKERPDGQSSNTATSGLGRGFRYSADFVAGVVAGCLLGWAFDHFLGTRPWGLIVFIVLGFAAGVWNLVKLIERDNRRDGA